LLDRDCTAHLVIALASVLVAAPLTHACSQEVGTAAAVNPSAQARGQGGSRTILIGQSIAHRERIQTTSAGSVQLLFLDKTSITIGPNSDLAIDEYVFDPKANTGKLAATLTKGIMRFVGGQISHSGNAQITTPSAMVGIRGGVGIIGASQVFIGYGQGTVTAGSSSVTLGAGEYTQTQQGVPPSNPTPPPPGLIGSLLANFQSQGNQDGGAPASASGVNQARAAATGSQNAAVVTQTFVNPAPNQGQPQTQQTVSGVKQTIAATNIQQNALSLLPPPQPTPSQSPTPPEPPAPPASTPTPPPPPPPANTPPPFTGGFTFTMTNCCGGAGPAAHAPYLPASFTTGNNYFVSQGIGYKRPEMPNAGPNEVLAGTQLVTRGGNTVPFMQWGMGISGSSANQTSWLSVATGEIVQHRENGTVLTGGFGATRRGAGNQAMGRASGFFSSTPGSMELGEQNLPASATVNQQEYVAATGQYRNVQAQYALSGTNTALTNYAFTQQLARTQAPTGLGSYRPDQTLSAWTGGLMQTVSGSSISSPFATFGVGQINLDPSTSRVQASFDLVNATPSLFDSFLFASFQLGSTDPSKPAQSAYIDGNNFAAREATEVKSNGALGQLSSVNGQKLMNSTSTMVNVPRDVARQILPGTTICECDYTKWGFWSTNTQRPGLFGGSRNDRGHMMTWVAGQTPERVEVPTTGSATYNGHVVANVQNGSNQYIASGNLQNTINFGTRTGTAQVSNFDNTNYSGALILGPLNDPRYFTAGLSGGNRTMLMNGGLFRGATSPVGEMGGNVLVGGPNYLASGIFAGKMK
jgi:hypothetical protein